MAVRRLVVRACVVVLLVSGCVPADGAATSVPSTSAVDLAGSSALLPAPPTVPAPAEVDAAARPPAAEAERGDPGAETEADVRASRRSLRAWVAAVRDPLLADAARAGSVPPDRRADQDADQLVAPVLVTAEGFLVVPGDAAGGEGAPVTYTVEVEPTLGADLRAVGQEIDEALHDPRSWVQEHRLERVEDPAAAAIRVVLATPDTVDALCGAVGLDTGGRYSCWTGEFAALNAWRWDEGASDFDDIGTYRRYLINHEVGHGLGFGHLGCPGPGQPAPVMMQQSITTGECVANPWPFPDGDAAGS